MGMGVETLLVREVANQLGVDRVEVYRLIRTGVLDGRPDSAGDMRVSQKSVEKYKTPKNHSPAA
jgi:predicted site-specific integrase-resolvase